MDTISIFAKITGRDRDTITADIHDTADGTRIGSVSLIISEQGLPTTAGMPDPTAWADGRILAWASDLEDEDGDSIDLRHVASAIEAAVEDATRDPFGVPAR